MLKKCLLVCWCCLLSGFLWAFDLTDLQNQLQQPQSIKGDFTQQRYLRSTSKPVIAQGQFVLVPKAGLLWQMKKPFTDTMRVRQSGIEQLNANNQWIASKQSAGAQKNQVKLFLDLLAGQTSGLQSQFTLQLEGTAQNWQLHLLPKSVLMKQIFTRIDIHGDSVVKKITLSEVQGDRTEITFTALKVNAALNRFEQHAVLP
ncbi:outer membrane lipoprotein carrier protein LolA [Snodgrassella sp. ESL0253]|uniref:outer membrane lipoprotein carrier protein LolA n=1 Tax=Snodgrassella sp. ESL0253 TaxID=2705031 RepID=UPI0015819633|nr:outer membrane lipoprotein carrier protein LolA [Snodgrassella sp. ESL0253]NUE67450.1 outer membrane lipoprotein carrier protein LolA [Snodgrassella sp. ESL0253]